MWVLNILLFLFWLAGSQGDQQAQAIYEVMKTNGAPCYTMVASVGDPAFPPSAEPPACFYDPGNMNTGIAAHHRDAGRGK